MPGRSEVRFAVTATAAALAALLPLEGAGQSLRAIAHHDLGGAGLNGPVAVVGTTAVVAAGIAPATGVHAHRYTPYPCPAVAVRLVDLSEPSRPRVVGDIPLPEGVAALDVAARRVSTSAFTGDLAALALVRCGGSGDHVDRGVAYWDITDPVRPSFLGRYMADSDSVFAPGTPPCGSPPEGAPTRCASSQYAVDLAVRTDGRVLSLSVEPGASASSFPSGDLRIVDVTDPRRPVQVGAFPDRGRPIFSSGGCRPFSAGRGVVAAPDGRRAYLAYYDDGLFVLDLDDPARPDVLGRWSYPSGRRVEGNAAHPTVTRIGDRTVALVAEEDWILPDTRLEVEGSGGADGSHVACETVFTLFDPLDRAALHRRTGHRVTGELVYLGRGCPANPGTGMHAGTPGTDPWLGDPAGRIAVLDRTTHIRQPDVPPGAGCTVAERALRAQEGGALAVVVGQTLSATPEAFSSDGDPAGVEIPVAQLDLPAMDALRDALCPRVEGGACAGGAPARGSLVADVGSWGALRVVDVTDPAAPRELAALRTPAARAFPPPDLGVRAPAATVVHGRLAFVAWHADGVRVIDLTDPDEPREIAAFVPAPWADPTGALPTVVHVTGVAVFEPTIPGDPLVVLATDMNGGLHVLAWEEGS